MEEDQGRRHRSGRSGGRGASSWGRVCIGGRVEQARLPSGRREGQQLAAVLSTPGPMPWDSVKNWGQGDGWPRGGLWPGTEGRTVGRTDCRLQPWMQAEETWGDEGR